MTTLRIFALGALALSACYPEPAPYVDPGCRCVGTLPSGARVEIACGERTCAGEGGFACVGVNTLVRDDSACTFDVDGGEIEPHAMDAGLGETIRARDAGQVRNDAGAVVRVDAGPPEACIDVVMDAWPSELAPLCAATTRTCAQACSNATCAFECANADATPALHVPEIDADVVCGDCVYSQLEYCQTQAGCADELHAFYCCLESNCPVDWACAETHCASEGLAVDTCTPPSCLDLGDPIYDVCFPPS